MRFKLFKKWWRLFFVTQVDKEGSRGETDDRHCDLIVLYTLRGVHRLEVILHELLHAANWAKKEEEVQASGVELSSLLWHKGLRLYKSPEPDLVGLLVLEAALLSYVASKKWRLQAKQLREIAQVGAKLLWDLGYRWRR